MIDEIILQKFKRFAQQKIPLLTDGVSLIAGANNSGKSTILHALAVWEFCRTILEAEKSFDAFLPGTRTQGLGLGDDEFSPINVPTLSHLWTNLAPQKRLNDQDGYTLRIRSRWTDREQITKELEFGLALANDRMFIKATYSNLQEGDNIPHIAYLPPFAGITDREARLPGAIRRRRIGEGLAGAVLRNMLLDLQLANLAERQRLRGDRSKIRDSDLQNLRENDAWEILQQALRATFNAELSIQPFRDEYHSYIKVEVIRGEPVGFRIKRFSNYKARDLMVEGSGFLQWLSVYTLAVDPKINILLLDEPDAHLHSSLQRQLLDKLEEIAIRSGKQVLVATHSVEILRNAPPQRILEVYRGRTPRFLSEETQKVGLLAGLGSDYAPKIDRIKQTRRLLMVEGEFDARILRQVANVLGITFSDKWVEWKSAAGHKERKQLFLALSSEIDNLVTVSLRDRDDESVATVGPDLTDTGHTQTPQDFHCKKWRRRHIESYLIWPPALAIASGRPQTEIADILRDDFGIAIGNNFQSTAPPQVLLEVRGKDILKVLGINANEIVQHMTPEEIPEDLCLLVNTLNNLA